MAFALIELPGLTLPSDAHWNVRFLSVDGRQPVLESLDELSQADPKAYRICLRIIVTVARVVRSKDERVVKKCVRHDEVYELRLPSAGFRMFFFYSKIDRALIITNYFKKGVGSQDSAFDRCEYLRRQYCDKKAALASNTTTTTEAGFDRKRKR